MKTIYIISTLILFFSCTGKKTVSDNKENEVTKREIVVPEFQTIIDSADVIGSIVIYDLKDDKYYSNDFKWAKKGYLPASTFKITNSIIALETGTVENDSMLFKWNGEKRRFKNWEQDLIFRDAFHYSCVPYYQEVARKIGIKRMSEYLDKLEYGNMKVDSTNIDLFWLKGESRINQFQQIDFLKRFYQSELPISERTESIMKRMMVIEDNDNYKISGKTGWSISDGNNNGWFVGYVETQDKTYFFATNVEPTQQFDMDMFAMLRKDLTFKIFEQMKTIKKEVTKSINQLKTVTFSQQLTNIEKSYDIKSLEQFLDNEVMLYVPDAPIIYSKEVVLNLFKYSWDRNKENTDINYKPNSIKKHHNEIIEEGIYSYKDGSGEKIEMPYSIVGVKINNKSLMKELVYANSKKELPVLPKPTGKYNIGQSINYYDNYIKSGRPLAFQIWYPTLEDSNSKIPYHSKNEAEAIARFLGWPLFNNSFTRLMKSNAINDVYIVPNKRFPVVIYNHGYGGATSVYQTVFEELASHGYIVVSVGHQDESAFLMKEDGSVNQNSPQNEFYAKRQPELNNRVIGIEQSTILNSDNSDELSKAYKKLVQLSPLHTESVKLWAFDTKNVIIELKKINEFNDFLKGGFNVSKMGIFGHSVGGATAGELSNTTIFKAGINIDGFQFGNLINTNLKVPFMFISSNEEGNSYLRVVPFANNSKFDTYHAIIKGFSHGSFSDLQLFSPNGVTDIQLQRKLILEFFNKYLKDKNTDFNSINSQYENLTINKLK